MAVRADDAEREACITALVDHHVQGRLDLEELDRRRDAALAAVTRADLKALLADLPETSATSSAQSSRRSYEAARLVIPATTVLGGAWFAQWAWQFSAEGPFLGAFFGGTLAFTVHTVMNRFRR